MLRTKLFRENNEIDTINHFYAAAITLKLVRFIVILISNTHMTLINLQFPILVMKPSTQFYKIRLQTAEILMFETVNT